MTSTNHGTNDFGDVKSLPPLKIAATASFFLSILKAVAWWWTGSLIILGSLLDSVADSVMSLLNHWLHGIARSDADREHPFGHGGLEVIAGIIQGLIILFLSFGLLSESVRKLYDDDAWIDPGSLVSGIGMMICAALGGWFIQFFLKLEEQKLQKLSKRSLSLKADRAHYAGDAVVNAVGAIGLSGVWYFELPWIDAAFGVLAAVFLGITSKEILMPCIRDVMHREVEHDLQKKIAQTILNHEGVLGLHQLRTRQLGPNLFIDFHMVLDGQLKLVDAHGKSDEVVRSLKQTWPDVDVVIHMDPDTEAPEELWEPSWRE